MSLVEFLFIVLFILNFQNTESTTICSATEADALLQFKNNFSISSSFSLTCRVFNTRTESWNASLDCCNWDGVTCDNATGHVIGLDLSCSGLSGTFPSNSSLFSLSHLQNLNIAGNLCSGPLPRELGNLNKLVQLNLGSNQITGTIPSSFSNLTQLQYLGLYHNLLVGPIPDQGISFLDLKELRLNSNLFNGSIPSWVYNAPLQVLDLSENQFNGQLGEFKSPSMLLSLNMEKNRLNGSIPSSIFQLLNLTDLHLSSNDFGGIIDLQMFSKLQNLEALDLSNNVLTLISDVNVSYKFPNLSSIELSSCNISQIPYVLKNPEYSLNLDLSNNRIHDIPTWTWDMGNFSCLNLSHNFLKEFEQPFRVSVGILDLSFNSIQGPLQIPPPISFFSMSNNGLVGDIPFPISDANALSVLDLSNNNLSGTIPRCIGNLSSLSVLNLRMNKFEGTIPFYTENCALEYINLSGNQFQGQIPNAIANCTFLEVLDFGNNNLSGSFPYWLGTLEHLQVLVLQSNKLHDVVRVSDTNNSFSGLQILDLSDNNFSGLFPAEFVRSLRVMINVSEAGNDGQYMKLNDAFSYYQQRQYDFSISLTLKGSEIELKKILNVLTSIDLSNNNFEGEIPDVIGKLVSLKGLNLSHNNFSSLIPQSIGSLANLEWLDLSSNSLRGEIPTELTYLPWLSVLNLSSNQLVGPIPQGKQFNTFDNTSYEGNLGLCGFPLSKSCSEGDGNHQSPPPASTEEGDHELWGFGWRVVLLGFGSGLAFGLFVGFLVFQTGKPKWFVNLVEEGEESFKTYWKKKLN